MKILLDMNASPEWVYPLRDAGHECFHWSAIGDPKADDKAIFHWAAQNGFVVYTHDLDFGAILAATNAQFPSVVQIRTQKIFPDDPDCVARILSYLQEFSETLAEGALVTVDELSARVRVLPIRNT
ncbi:MAG: DUF5615 family PIN-like protein [Saprospiraceae bacterium]